MLVDTVTLFLKSKKSKLFYILKVYFVEKGDLYVSDKKQPGVKIYIR